MCGTQPSKLGFRAELPVPGKRMERMNRNWGRGLDIKQGMLGPSPARLIPSSHLQNFQNAMTGFEEEAEEYHMDKGPDEKVINHLQRHEETVRNDKLIDQTGRNRVTR